MKKGVAFLLSLVMALAALFVVGCGDDGIDPNRTQLYIGVKDDGYGRDWFDAIVAEYEARNPDIQIMPTFKDQEYESANLLANIKYDNNDAYIVSLDYYSAVNMNGTSEYLEDMSDVANEGGENSIWNRWDASKNFYNVGTEDNPKVFALPYVRTFWSLIYDKDMFRTKGLYDLDSYKGIDCISNTEDDNYGPDGLEGTYDDGLPATWEDFKKLMKEMKDKGITPFTWTGMYYSYRTQFLNTIIANYEGLNDFYLRYSYDGVDSQFGEITEENGWKLAGQEGVKAALIAAKDIAGNSSNYSSRAFNTTQSHLEAQLEFIKSVKSNNPIGFLIEGGWWETEAKSTFAEMVEEYGEGYGYGERNFGIMPIPRFIGTDGVADQENTRPVITGSVSSNVGTVIVNKKSERKALAKDFLKFMSSEEMCEKFTEITGCIRPLKYTLSDEQLSHMTEYGRSIWSLYCSEDVDVVPSTITSRLQLSVPSYFYNWNNSAGLYSAIGSKKYDDPLKAFSTDSNLTVDAYFEGIKNVYNETTWNDKLGSIFGK